MKAPMQLRALFKNSEVGPLAGPHPYTASEPSNCKIDRSQSSSKDPSSISEHTMTDDRLDGSGAGNQTPSLRDGRPNTVKSMNDSPECQVRSIEEHGVVTSPDAVRDNENHEKTESGEKASAPPQGETDEQHENYLHGAKLVMLTVTLMLGQFLTGLDSTVITTAIPKITADFHSLDDVGWYGSSYLLTTMALQPSFGKVYMYFDIKLVFVFSVLIFEAGSIICAAATSSSMFIVGRSIAGIGQAALLSGGMTVIGYRVPLAKRAIYFALLSSMNGVASLIGPPLGGFFTDTPRLTWRFCFWINVPLGAITLLLGFFCFQSPARPALNLKIKDKLAKMDPLGAAMFISSMVCLFLALQRGGSQYPWSDSRVWGCLLGFALTLILFIALQFRLGDDATIPPRMLSRKTVVACYLFSCLVSIGFNTHAYYLPFYFQSAKGVSAESSGLRLIPYLASLMVVSLIIGGLMIASGLCVPFMWFGSIVFTVASGLLTTLQVNSSTGVWAGYQVLAGTGFGSTVQIAAVAIQAALPADDLPTGNALILLSNFLGGALGVSIAASIFSNVLTQQLSQKVPQLDAGVILAAGATAIPSVVPPALLPAVLDSYSFAISRVFIMPTVAAGVAFLCTFGVEWRNIRKPKLVDTGGSA
ncbi:hypothetical protein MMC30_003800 [Trapelia coarctata]|nr:hypothetical protein [Trapelia coarctata]